MFAIENIDPTIGHVTANWTKREQGEKELKVPIELVECEQLLPGGLHDG